jgi:hypothetical protein
MAFSGTADAGIAGQISDTVHVHNKYHRAASHSCGGQRGFASRMSRTDYDYIIFTCYIRHLFTFFHTGFEIK